MILDKLKSFKLREDDEQGTYPVTLHVSVKDRALIAMVCKRYHIKEKGLLQLILRTGIDTLYDESGLVRK